LEAVFDSTRAVLKKSRQMSILSESDLRKQIQDRIHPDSLIGGGYQNGMQSKKLLSLVHINFIVENFN